MRSLIATTCLALAAVGCADPDLGAEGEICAEVVGFYLEAGGPVGVTGGERNGGLGRVLIDYRFARGGETLEGVALCRFQAGPAGPELQDAFVDDNRLRDDEIRAFAASRSGAPASVPED